MAYTLTDLAELDAKIAGGELTVKYQDRQVTYRSLDEMTRIRDIMRRELGVVSGAGGRVYPRTSKGLD